MSSDDSNNREQVVVKSAWVGNIFLIVCVVVILGGALAYKEFF